MMSISNIQDMYQQYESSIYSFFRRLKAFLISIQSLSFSDQKEKIDVYFNQWKGEEEQVDDVLLIGVKV